MKEEILHLQNLVKGIEIGQAHGAYNLQDAAALHGSIVFIKARIAQLEGLLKLEEDKKPGSEKQ